MTQPATREEGRSKLRDLIQGIDTAVLTTAATDGSLHSRPMAALEPDGDGELWFFTDEPTGKTKDVVLNPKVGVTYAEPQKKRFVSVSGKAELVHDRERMKQLWRPALKSWFARGLDDPDLALLRVDIDDAQYWDAPTSKLVQLARRMSASSGVPFGDAARSGNGGQKSAKGESGELPIKTRIGPDTAA